MTAKITSIAKNATFPITDPALVPSRPFYSELLQDWKGEGSALICGGSFGTRAAALKSIGDRFRCLGLGSDLTVSGSGLVSFLELSATRYYELDTLSDVPLLMIAEIGLPPGAHVEETISWLLDHRWSESLPTIVSTELCVSAYFTAYGRHWRLHHQSSLGVLDLGTAQPKYWAPQSPDMPEIV